MTDGLLAIDAYTLRRRDSRVRSRMTRKGWESLLAYDTSFPTGVRIGKRWRRTDPDGKWVGAYQYNRTGGVEIVFRLVQFVEGGKR